MDLLEIANRVLSEVESTMGPRRFEVDERGDLRGRWDPDRLAQVLSNLSANAAQHGDPGQPLTVRLDGLGPDAVTVSVENGGMIPAELLPLVFEPFRQGERRETKSSGLGLGLYISKEIALAHGGDLQVSSTPEIGTRFTLRLPR